MSSASTPERRKAEGQDALDLLYAYITRSEIEHLFPSARLRELQFIYGAYEGPASIMWDAFHHVEFMDARKALPVDWETTPEEWRLSHV